MTIPRPLRPVRDLEGESLLGNALMLNGVATEVCGSSRPASGSEHLISHALDSTSKKPRLDGLQAGVATYLVSHGMWSKAGWRSCHERLPHPRYAARSTFLGAGMPALEAKLASEV